MVDERFLAVVKGQAEARVEMDMQTFIGFFLPEAMEQIGGQVRGRGQPIIAAKQFEVLEAESEGDTGHSVVKYSGAGSFVLKQGWRRVNEAWRVVDFERPPELVVGPTLLQRIKAFPQRFRTVRMASRPPGGGMRR